MAGDNQITLREATEESSEPDPSAKAVTNAQLVLAIPECRACRVLGQPRLQPALPLPYAGSEGATPWSCELWGWPRASGGHSNRRIAALPRAEGWTTKPRAGWVTRTSGGTRDRVPWGQPETRPPVAQRPPPVQPRPTYRNSRPGSPDPVAARTHKRTAPWSRGGASTPGNAPATGWRGRSRADRCAPAASPRLFDRPQVVSGAPRRGQSTPGFTSRAVPGRLGRVDTRLLFTRPGSPRKKTATRERASTADCGTSHTGREILYTIQGAQVLNGGWRQTYNQPPPPQPRRVPSTHS